MEADRSSKVEDKTGYLPTGWHRRIVHGFPENRIMSRPAQNSTEVIATWIANIDHFIRNLPGHRSGKLLPASSSRSQLLPTQIIVELIARKKEASVLGASEKRALRRRCRLLFIITFFMCVHLCTLPSLSIHFSVYFTFLSLLSPNANACGTCVGSQQGCHVDAKFCGMAWASARAANCKRFC